MDKAEEKALIQEKITGCYARLRELDKDIPYDDWVESIEPSIEALQEAASRVVDCFHAAPHRSQILRQWQDLKAHRADDQRRIQDLEENLEKETTRCQLVQKRLDAALEQNSVLEDAIRGIQNTCSALY